MKNIVKKLKYFLGQTVHLLLYFMMGVSFLSIVLPWFGINFNYVTWGNGGGYSIACDIIFIERFSFSKRYCGLTRMLPISMIFINILNIISNEFFHKHYEIYGKWYEIIIFSVILMIALVLCINKKLNK